MPYVLPATPPPPPSLATPKQQSSRFLEVHPHGSGSSSSNPHAHNGHSHGHMQSKKTYTAPSDIQSSNSAGARLPGIPRRTPSSGPSTPTPSTSSTSTFTLTPSPRRSRFILDESSSGSSSDSDAEDVFDTQDVLEESDVNRAARKGKEREKEGDNVLLDARAERARMILASRLGGERNASGVDERRDVGEGEGEKVAGCVFVSESESDCATPTMASGSSPSSSIPSTSTSSVSEPSTSSSSSSTHPNAPLNSTNSTNSNSSIPGIAPRAPRGRGRARVRGAAVFDLDSHGVSGEESESTLMSDEVDAGLPMDSSDTLMKISGGGGDGDDEEAARPVSGAVSGASVVPPSGARSTSGPTSTSAPTPTPTPPSIRIHVQGPLTPPSSSLGLVPFPTSIGTEETPPILSSSSSSSSSTSSSSNSTPAATSQEAQGEQEAQGVAMGETIMTSPPPVPGIKRTNAQSLKLDLDALGNYARPVAPVPATRSTILPPVSAPSVPSSSSSSSTIHNTTTSSITRSTSTSLVADTTPLIRKKSGEVLKSSLKRRSQSHCSSSERPGLPVPFLVGECTPVDDGGGGITLAGAGRRGSVGCGAVVDPSPSPSLSSSSTPSTSTALSVGIQQQSSLSKSLPATPTSSKFVHFDAQLEHVKLFLAEQKPLAVSRDGSPTDETGTEGETGSASEGGYPWRGAGGGGGGGKKGKGYGSEDEEMQRRALVMRVLNLPSGRRPSSPPTTPTTNTTNAPSHTMSGIDVLLETLELASDGLNVHGTVRVRNLAFEKRVAVRFTLDGWQTTSEVGARWGAACRGDGSSLSSSSSGGNEGGGGEQFDRFEFSIRLGDMLLGKLQDKTLVLAVRYVCAGREMWDSNGGENYRAVFERRSPVVEAPTGTSANTSAATTSTIGRGLGELERKLEKVFLKAGDGESPGPTPLPSSSSMMTNKTATTTATATMAGAQSHSLSRLSPSSSSSSNAGIPVSSSVSASASGHGSGHGATTAGTATGGTAKAETLSARYDFAASLKKPWKPRDVDGGHVRMNTFPASFTGHGHAHSHSSVPWPKKQYSHPNPHAQSQASPSHPLSPEWRKNARAAFSPPPVYTQSSAKRYAPGSPRDGHNSDNENGVGAPVHRHEHGHEHRHEHGHNGHGHGRRHQRSYFDTWAADHGISSSNGYRDAHMYRDAHVRRTPPGTPERSSASLFLQNAQQNQVQRSLSDADASTVSVGSSRTTTPNNEFIPHGSHSPSPVHSPGPGRYHSFPPLLSPNISPNINSNPTQSSTSSSSSSSTITGLITAPQISLRTSTDSTSSTISTSSTSSTSSATSSVSTSSTSSSTNTSLVSSPALVSPLDFESLMTLSSSSAPGLPRSGEEDGVKGFGFTADAVETDGGGVGMRSPVDENGYKFFLNKFCFYTGREASASFLDIPQHPDMMRRSYSASSVEEFLSPSPFPPSSPSPGPSHPSSPYPSSPSPSRSPFPSDVNGSGSGSGMGGGMGGGTGQSTPTRASSFDSVASLSLSSSFSGAGMVTPRQRFGSFGFLEVESPRAGGEREREREMEMAAVRG